MILIYPPVAKISEPPAGLALLFGAMKQNNIKCKAIDANLKSLLWLANSVLCLPDSESFLSDSWTKRALLHFDQNLADLKDQKVYKNIGRYKQRVMDINRLIEISLPKRFKISLCDYSDSNLTPVQSKDLLKSALQYFENPFYKFFEQFLRPKIEDPNFINIGISICYLSQALTGFALAGWVKANFPEKKIILGGGLITSWMSSPNWKNPFKDIIDVMVKGPGEQHIVKLSKADIKIKKRVIPDFDFCDWDSYIAPGKIMPYRTSIGCYWNKCKFCPEKAEGHKYQPQKNIDTINDLIFLYKKYKFDYVHFLDNALSPSFLKTICLNPMPFRWYSFVRFTSHLQDPAFCKQLYKSGCRMLKLGLESGDQDVLDMMNKGTNIDLVSKTLESLKQAGISTYIYILFGTSFEDETYAQKTLSYVAQQSNKIDFLNVAIFNLPKFSEDAKELITEKFYTGDLSFYLNFKHPLDWERKKIRQFLDKKFKKNPLIANILRKNPPFFTSNHAMFLT